MNTLRAHRNRVADFRLTTLPGPRANAAIFVDQILATVIGGFACESVDEGIRCVHRFLNLKEHTSEYFALNARVIIHLLNFIVDPTGCRDQRTDLIRSLIEAVQHQRRAPECSLTVDWKPLLALIEQIYLGEGALEERVETIDLLVKLVKECVHVGTQVLELGNYLLHVLISIDLNAASAADSIAVIFTLLACLPSEVLEAMVKDQQSELWTFYNRRSPVHFAPFLELNLVYVLCRIEDASALIGLMESGLLQDLVWRGLELVGIPALATAPDCSSSHVEFVGIPRVLASLLQSERSMLVAHVGKLIANLACHSEVRLVEFGNRCLSLLAMRTQNLLLPSTKTDKGDAAGRWSVRLAALYGGIAGQVRKKILKQSLLTKAPQIAGGQPTGLLQSGIENCVQHCLAGGLGTARRAMDRYQGSYVDLILSSNTAVPDRVLTLAKTTLEDVHKGMTHSIVLATAVLPLASCITRLQSDGEAEFLSFLLEYCVSAIDTTNLLKASSALVFLQTFFTQVPHGITLKDLSLGASVDPISARLMTLSTWLGDWSCSLLDRFLTVSLSLPKPKVKDGSFSTESVELSLGELIRQTWLCAASNSSFSHQRHLDLFQDFISRNIRQAKPASASLIGYLLGASLRVANEPSLPILDWLLIKAVHAVESSESAALGRNYLILLAQAVRWVGVRLEPFLGRLQKLLHTILLKPECEKFACKLVQRICECLCSMYVVELGSFGGGGLKNVSDQFLLGQIGKPATDLSKHWWFDESEVQWHVPRDSGVVKQFLTPLLDDYSVNPPGTLRHLRTARAVLYGLRKSQFQQALILPELQTALIETLLARPPPISDVKQTSLWLKAVRSLARGSVSPAQKRATAALKSVLTTLADLTGRASQKNGGPFGVLGKEFKDLDKTRFAFCVTLDNFRRLTPPLPPAGLMDVCVNLLTSTPFDKLRESAAATLGSLLQVTAETSIGEIHAILQTSSLLPQLHEVGRAKGLAMLFNRCHEVSKVVLRNESALLQLFQGICIQLAESTLDLEDREAFTGILRDLWEERDKQPLRESAGSATVILRSLTPHLFWQSQASVLIMGYMFWRFHSTRDSPEILKILSTLLTGSLAKSVQDMAVFWIQAILNQDDSLPIPQATVLRVSRIFALARRFETRNSQDSLVTTIVETIVKDEGRLNLFAHTAVPTMTNKGIVKAHVAFWHVVFRKGRIHEWDRASVVKEIFAQATNEPGDDSHCAALELLAAGVLSTPAEWDLAKEFIDFQILRTDGALLPTVATAVRMALFERRPTPLLSGECPEVNVSVLNRMWTILTHSFGTVPSSLNDWRYALVLYHAICSDWDCLSKIEKLDPARFISWTSGQLGEYTSTIVAHILAWETNCLGGHSLSDLVGDRMKDGISDDVGKLFMLRTDSKFMKLARRPSPWSTDLVPVALQFVSSSKEDEQAEARKHLSLVARYAGVNELPWDRLSSVVRTTNDRKALLEMIVSMSINGLLRPQSSFWTRNLDELDSHWNTYLLDRVRTALTNSLISVNETSDLGWLKAVKDAFLNCLVICTASVSGSCGDQAELRIVELCAAVSVETLSHDVHDRGIEAVSRLGLAMPELKANHNLKKLAETTLNDFFKGLSDKGTREATEKRFSPDVLSIINAGKGKHSYIS